MPHTNRKPGYRARKDSAASHTNDGIKQRKRAISNTAQANKEIPPSDESASNTSHVSHKLPHRSCNKSLISYPVQETSDGNNNTTSTSRATEEVNNSKSNVSTTSRPTPPKSSLHGAGTSASWSSANNTNIARFERLEKMAGHNGFDSSPFMPKSPVELLKHEKDFTHDRAQEELRILKNMITSSESAKRTGHAVGRFMCGKKMPVMGGVWEVGAEERTKAAWPGQAEYRRYGDSAAYSVFKLLRHLPPPRNRFVTKVQVLALVKRGMREALAISSLGKDARGTLEGLQWDDMSVLGEYKNDEELIIEEARNSNGDVSGNIQMCENWDSESLAAERQEFNERAMMAIGVWGELLDEVNGLRFEFADKI